MITMTLTAIAAAVGGVVHDADPELEVNGDAFIDSRTVVPGGLFVALPGQHVDGHAYAAAAVHAGAAAVLAGRPVGVPSVLVSDPVEALGRLAHQVLSQRRGLTVIGITGSQGKTSTKDIVAQLLERRGATVAPVGSFNTEIGVPLTALRTTAETQYLISEMGARGHGHITYLALMVRPSIGAVLNVGVAHLGEFGTQDDIAATKGELVEALPDSGLAVLNRDDPRVHAMLERTSARVLTFGTSGESDIRLSNVHTDDDGHACFTLAADGKTADVSLLLVGEHQAGNAAAAAAIALGCGMPFEEVVLGLSSAVSRSPWRMEVTTTAGGVTVINDAYNANPDSMKAGLKALADMGHRRTSGRTFAVLGEMGELGDASGGEHEAIGRLVARLGISRLVVVGDAAKPMYLGATGERSVGHESVCVPDVEAAVRFLTGAVRAGDIVLVKASRVASLERVAAGLLGKAGLDADPHADEGKADA